MTQIAKKGAVTATSSTPTIRQTLMSEAMQAQIRLALPKHVKAERLVRIVLTQLQRVQHLDECEPKSFLGALMECAALGLEPGTLGQAWIIPFRNNKTNRYEAQLIVGYRGLVQLAYRSAQIASIRAQVVYEEDLFDYSEGLEPRLEHKPASNSTHDPRNITHAYAVVHTTTGGVIHDVMSIGEIESVRARSRAGKSGPWVTDYAEMCKKTVLRRCLKLCPASAEIQRAQELEETLESGERQVFDAGAIDLKPAEVVEEVPAPKQKEETPAEDFSDV